MGRFIMIDVTTKYTKESYRKFQWFHITRGGVRKVVVVIMLAFMFCVGALLMSMRIIDVEARATSLFLSLLLLFFPTFYTLLPRISASSAFKKSPALFDTGLTFTFHEDYFTVQTTGMVSGTSDIRYEALYRVYQTKDYFYLYLQQRQSYIVDKKDFTAGKPEELAVLLDKAMPAKKYRSWWTNPPGG